MPPQVGLYAIILRPGFRLFQSHSSAISPIIPSDCEEFRAENKMSGIIPDQAAANKPHKLKVSKENLTINLLIS